MPPSDIHGGAPPDVRPGRSSAIHPIRVLLVDDDPGVPKTLAHALDGERDIRVVGVATSVAGVRDLARRPADVALLDYRLPDGTGADATRAIKARSPATRVVMLSPVDDDETLRDSIQAGADGYITRDQALEDVVAMVRAAHAGATLLPRSVVETIARQVAEARDRKAGSVPVESLTPREFEVLRALTDGLSTPAICKRLRITPNTLRTHVQNVMGKLHVHSKLEAVAVALRLGLVMPPRAG